MSDATFYTDLQGSIDITTLRDRVEENFGTSRRRTWATVTDDTYDCANAEDAILILGTGASTVNLPASPGDGEVYLVARDSATGVKTVGRNSENINGAASDYVMPTTASASSLFMWTGEAAYGWHRIDF